MTVAPAITAEGVKSHLVGLDAWFAAAARSDAKYDDAHIQAVVIPRAVRRFERETKFAVNAVQVFSNPDGAYNSNDLLHNAGSTLPARQDSPYPFFDFMATEYYVNTLNYKPVQQVQRLRMMLDATTVVYDIPSTWFRVDAMSGRFYLQPVMTGALVTGAATAYALLSVAFGYRSYVPQILAFDYIAGLPTGWQNSPDWLDLGEIIEKYTALRILKDISHVKDPGVNSKSLLALGATQSTNYTRFADLKQELETDVKAFQEDFMAQQTPVQLAWI